MNTIGHSRNKSRRVITEEILGTLGKSLRPRPDDYVGRVPMTSISDLDLMIAQGWGDTPQKDIPADWRTRRKE